MLLPTVLYTPSCVIAEMRQKGEVFKTTGGMSEEDSGNVLLGAL